MRKLNINIALSMLVLAVLIVQQVLCQDTSAAGSSTSSSGEKKGEDGMREDVKEFADECADKHLSDDSKGLLEDDEEADNGEIRCFWACVMKKLKLRDGKKLLEDKIQDMIYKHFDDDTAKQLAKVTKICIDESKDGENECEVSGKYTKCMFDKQKTVID